jgi:benzylsuccinate CoA-transferase BbsF subunit
MGLYQNGEVGPENASAYQNWNAGKLGITLNLKTKEGLAVARDLVRWADVVTESYSPKAMRGFGLDYESLRKINPKLIMLSSCLMGQTGPLSKLAGYGMLSSAIVGYHNVTGWPDRPPAGPFLAYTDTVSPRFTVALIMAALDHRQRTGEGQYIDQSQAEAALHCMSPALLDYTVNGRVQGRVGNRDAHMAPHGVYPAAGDDRWVAIAVASDEQWQALCQIIERSDLAGDERYASQAARLKNTDELDEVVGEWTTTKDPGEIEALLQARSIPAYVVQGSDELFADPQLQHRGQLVEVAHAIHGTTTVEGSRFRLSRTPAKIENGAPTFGQHNFHILESILGYNADRIAELAAAGVLE